MASFSADTGLSALLRGRTLVDMHLHTRVSKDAFASVDAILSIARGKGVGIAVTDHNEIDGALEACEKAGPALVIPGIEVKADDGVDVILYFYDPADLERYYVSVVEPRKARNSFMPDITEREIIEGAAPFRCLISAPHPFAPRLLGLGGVVESGKVARHLLDGVTFVEAVNGCMSAEVNEQARSWGVELGKVLVGGSDAHVARHVGTVVTAVEVRAGEHVLEALKRGGTVIVNDRASHLETAFVFVLGQIKLLTCADGWHIFRENLRTFLSLDLRSPPEAAPS